ncbi:BCCT family transporter [Oceanimonas doudoroffii]|uniref:Choline transporter n=1 Tax=Oceanimonas doudoroffii TaxID=84158 RepID=A0A233RIG7_9GAMM|nr:BCCT family transporter [Oceanimonas doudoroffii]OXY83180.1 choline transporter [Oceanimonas doudoroffii]
MEQSFNAHKKRVAIKSILILAIFIAFLFALPEKTGELFKFFQSWIGEKFGWFYMSSVAFFMLILAYCGFGRAGNLRLGKDNERPEHNFFAWGAMLFCTGMGIGLVFFGVAEPVMHYLSPPVLEGGTDEAVRKAINISYFHWGINAWAIYCIVALLISYAAYRKGRPIEMRSALYPLIGNRVDGWIGDFVDTFAVLATVVGIVTPLGFGVMQINSGLNYVMDVPQSLSVQLVLILFISLVTCASLILGLEKGIKRLSVFNICIAISLMLFVFVVGETSYILNATVENVGDYLANLIPLTFETYSLSNPQWFQGWTLLYWAWWIAFAAPTGLFIARISKGRTIREFILGVLIIPVGFSFAWFSIFGNTALDMIHNQGMSELGAAVMADSSTALFKFFDMFSGWTVIGYVVLLCIFVFFITTADSGTMVINILTSRHEDKAPKLERVFWVVLVSGITGVLLAVGGMSAIQSVLVVLGFPFALLVTIMCFGFVKSIALELNAEKKGSLGSQVDEPNSHTPSLDTKPQQEVPRFSQLG